MKSTHRIDRLVMLFGGTVLGYDLRGGAWVLAALSVASVLIYLSACESQDKEAP